MPRTTRPGGRHSLARARDSCRCQGPPPKRPRRVRLRFDLPEAPPAPAPEAARVLLRILQKAAGAQTQAEEPDIGGVPSRSKRNQASRVCLSTLSKCVTVRVQQRPPRGSWGCDRASDADGDGPERRSLNESRTETRPYAAALASPRKRRLARPRTRCGVGLERRCCEPGIREDRGAPSRIPRPGHADRSGSHRVLRPPSPSWNVGETP
jgi:hypothetical protein